MLVPVCIFSPIRTPLVNKSPFVHLPSCLFYLVFEDRGYSLEMIDDRESCFVIMSSNLIIYAVQVLCGKMHTLSR